jgi:hypothetical protein
MGSQRSMTHAPDEASRVVYSGAMRATSGWGGALGLVLAGGLLAVACGGDQKGPAVPTAGPSTGEAFGGVQCSAVRPQTEPDLMAWDSGSRATLKSIEDQGVAVVHYEAEGCNVSLHVLPNCVAKGSYSFSAYSATETKMARNANELFAELPVGAAKLSTQLKGTRAIRTDYMMAGVESLKIGSTFKREELVGDCADATHVVSKIYVGGFALAAGETRDLEGGASVFVAPAVSAGGGAKSESAVEHLQHEGVAKACEEAQEKGTPSPQCSVPLRIALMSLGAQEVACPTGATWDGKQCVRKNVVTEVQCPGGATWDGSKCLATATATTQNPATPAVAAPSIGTIGTTADAPFDRRAAGEALASISIQSCKKPDGSAGSGHVTLTFDNDGSVRSAVVDQPPFAGTPVGGCIAAKFRAARVPPFGGSLVKIGKSFALN